jgi:hypothetical protein
VSFGSGVRRSLFDVLLRLAIAIAAEREDHLPHAAIFTLLPEKAAEMAAAAVKSVATQAGLLGPDGQPTAPALPGAPASAAVPGLADPSAQPGPVVGPVPTEDAAPPVDPWARAHRDPVAVDSWAAMTGELLAQIVRGAGSIRRAAKVLDVPKSTLATWVKQHRERGTWPV